MKFFSTHKTQVKYLQLTPEETILCQKRLHALRMKRYKNKISASIKKEVRFLGFPVGHENTSRLCMYKKRYEKTLKTKQKKAELLEQERLAALPKWKKMYDKMIENDPSELLIKE